MRGLCLKCRIVARARLWELKNLIDLGQRGFLFSTAQAEQVLSDVHVRLDSVKGCTCMASKQSKKDTSWKGFANVPFNAEARGRYEQWSITANALYQAMEDVIAKGYRFTFSYDATNQASQCSITCQNDKDANAGYTLTSRGPTWYDALSVGLFKHLVLTEGEWPLNEKTTGDKWG